MALIKTRARGLKLDDTFAFTGSVSGAGGGKLLQTQSTSSNSRTTISSGSFSGCGLEDTITCSSTSSKVLILVSANFVADSNNQAVTYVTAKFQLTRNHSGISETEIFRTRGMHNRPENSGMDMIFAQNLDICFLDSPSTTNELTYALNGLNDPSSSGLEITAGGSSEFTKAITLIEIGA
jgi:hypothetical protein